MRLAKYGLALIVLGVVLAGCYGPGTYTTPAQIKTGWYHAFGNAPGSPLCTWERDDKTGNAIGHGWGHSGPQYARVEPNAAGDVTFKTAGCQNWVQVDGPFDKRFVQGATVATGTYRVGIELAPGVYEVDPAYPDCHWQRLRGFRGEDSDTLSEGGTNAGPYVTVAPTDVGLRLTDCGTLTRE